MQTREENHPHIPSGEGREKTLKIPAASMQAGEQGSATRRALPRGCSYCLIAERQPQCAARSAPAAPPLLPPPPPPLAPGAEPEPRASASARPASAGRAGSASSLGDGAAELATRLLGVFTPSAGRGRAQSCGGAVVGEMQETPPVAPEAGLRSGRDDVAWGPGVCCWLGFSQRLSRTTGRILEVTRCGSSPASGGTDFRSLGLRE